MRENTESRGAGRRQGLERYGGEFLGKEDKLAKVGEDGRELHSNDNELGGEVD